MSKSERAGKIQTVLGLINPDDLNSTVMDDVNEENFRRVIKEIDRDEFLEEVVDAFNYFLSMMVLVGVDSDEFYNAYVKKDKKKKKSKD